MVNEPSSILRVMRLPVGMMMSFKVGSFCYPNIKGVRLKSMP